MTRQEFLEQLRRALGSRVNSGIVNENISYYEEYIAAQVRAGKDEKEVIAGLGDPRLLARSIADANKREGMAGEEEAGEETADVNESMKRHSYSIPGWLIAVCIIIFVILILGAVFSVIKVLFPFIIPVAIVIFFLRILQIK